MRDRSGSPLTITYQLPSLTPSCPYPCHHVQELNYLGHYEAKDPSPHCRAHEQLDEMHGQTLPHGDKEVWGEKYGSPASNHGQPGWWLHELDTALSGEQEVRGWRPPKWPS